MERTLKLTDAVIVDLEHKVAYCKNAKVRRMKMAIKRSKGFFLSKPVLRMKSSSKGP